MARLFTPEQQALLRAPAIKLRVLITFYLDEGTFRFCDDSFDVYDGEYWYVGAQPLAASLDVRSGRDLAAEPITLMLDGNRMAQAGIADPAKVLAEILTYLYHQRRVDIAFGFSYPDQKEVNLRVPISAMKINYARVTNNELSYEDAGEPIIAKLEIVMDSLAARYQRAPYRTRSHADQQEIDPTDMFFSFTADASNTERTLFWGKKSSVGSSAGGLLGGFLSAISPGFRGTVIR